MNSSNTLPILLNLAIVFKLTIISVDYFLNKKSVVFSYNLFHSIKCHLSFAFQFLTRFIFGPLLFANVYQKIYANSIFKIEYNLLNCILLFIIIDFFYYLTHFMSHRIKFFWRFHYSHHLNENFNTLTTFRFSYFEFINFIFTFCMLSLFFKPSLIFAINILFQSYMFYLHSSIRSPKYMHYLFITPKEHFIHHQILTTGVGHNFGGCLSIWDRIFDTLKLNSATERIGVKNANDSNKISTLCEGLKYTTRTAKEITDKNIFMLFLISLQGLLIFIYVSLIGPENLFSNKFFMFSLFSFLLCTVISEFSESFQNVITLSSLTSYCTFMIFLINFNTSYIFGIKNLLNCSLPMLSFVILVVEYVKHKRLKSFR